MCLRMLTVKINGSHGYHFLWLDAPEKKVFCILDILYSENSFIKGDRSVLVNTNSFVNIIQFFHM